MKKAVLFTAGIIGLCFQFNYCTAQVSPVTTESLKKTPLAFTKNMGQWDERVLFRANAGGATMWYTNEGVTYQFFRRINCSDELATLIKVESSHPLRESEIPNCGVEQLALMARFIGANLRAEIAGEGRIDYKCNFFIGNVAEKWRIDVPNYNSVVYKEIYPGIDLKYYSNGDGKMEYDFNIKSGADPSQISIRYDGAESICVDDRGQLVIETAWGQVIELAPVVYQLDGDEIVRLRSEYVLHEKNTFGFKLIDSYRPDLALVIDPILSYSTYLGGSGPDRVSGIAVDKAGVAYMIGSTRSANFPTVDPYQDDAPESDVFLTKISASGDSLIYSTYLGAENWDWGNGIAIDDSGYAYLTGNTYSHTFPLQNPFQVYQGQGNLNVFVTKVSPQGNALEFSTYLGATNDGWDSYGAAIDVDNNGCAYVTGHTWSPSFPTRNPFQIDPSPYVDAFVTKFNPSGDTLIYSTYLGGDSSDQAWGVVVDSEGCAYVTGGTASPNYPTLNSYQTYNGTSGVFVTKLSTLGSTLVYSSFLGGSAGETARSIAVDLGGNAYLTGYTTSPDFPTINPYQLYQGGIDAFALKLSATGNALVYSTYLGGSMDDYGRCLTANDQGYIYVTGHTSSPDFPSLQSLQSFQGGVDAFVSKLNFSGDTLIFSSLLGGNEVDSGLGIGLDSMDNVFVTGSTASDDFPMLNPYQAISNDIFCAKLREFRCGDCDNNGVVNISDAVYLINYVFVGGPAPNPLLAGDADCNGIVTISDAVCLINYIFSGGAAPCAACL